MLLLTDRMAAGHRFKVVLDDLQSCSIQSVEDACRRSPVHAAIACHAALDDGPSRDRLTAALAHHRPRPEIPVLFLLRDDDPDAETIAREMGATEVIPEGAPDADIVAAMRRCIRAAVASRYAVIGDKSTSNAAVEDVGRRLADLFLQAQQRKSITIPTLRTSADTLVASVKQCGIRRWLEVVKRYDDVTYQHCLLVAGLVAAFAARLGLSLERQNLLSQAALVHDIGKVDIPRGILRKPGPLTSAEMDVMRTHPRAGHRVLSQHVGHDPLVLDVVLHHHEFLDGTGYPERLGARNIPEAVRLVTICDIYAALIERRSYKPEMSREDSRAVLIGMTGKLDAGLLKAFDSVIRDT